jgi:hypothetical protein
MDGAYCAEFIASGADAVRMAVRTQEFFIGEKHVCGMVKAETDLAW